MLFDLKCVIGFRNTGFTKSPLKVSKVQFMRNVLFFTFHTLENCQIGGKNSDNADVIFRIDIVPSARNTVNPIHNNK